VTGPRLRWHVFPDGETLTSAVTQAIATAAGRAVSAAGRFTIVLAGGSTPRPVYASLAPLDLPWDRWHVYFSDERCLPAGHADRNDVMARKAWLDRVPIPAGQVHAIPAEAGPEAAAENYNEEFKNVGPFDLALLGLGEDGHTASLFPGHPLGAEPGAPDVLAVRGAPKPPPSRVTLSARRLTRSRAILLLASGREKREALNRLRHEAGLPIHAVRPRNGIDVFVDRAAAPDDVS